MEELSKTAPRRLDQYVAEYYEAAISRAFAAKLVNDGKVTVNGKVVDKPGYRLRAGDAVVSDFVLEDRPAVPDITLEVLYEDDDCIVINKPIGLLTHSKGAYNPEATVATWLRSRLAIDFANVNDRAGIVHRLDRATSGVMITAKNQAALSLFQKQFSQRKVKKTYAAIVAGHLKNSTAVIDMPIERNPKAPATFRVGPNGKSATTLYVVERTTEHFSLLDLKPTTGRTHQLRVHLSQIGHPIIGDPIYSSKTAERLFLHAQSLEITLPNRERKVFTVPLPDSFGAYLDADE